ncbi:MAG: hypothetical protein OXH38_11910 [Chloroflexi bacterium]|nr:hypothetical protein [Chloroflexota bacterium]
MAIRWHRPADVRERAWLDAYQTGTDDHEPQFVDPWKVSELRFWVKRRAYLEKQNPSELTLRQCAFRRARRNAPHLSDSVIARIVQGVERQAEFYCTRTISERFRKRQARRGRLGGVAGDSRPGGLARGVAIRLRNQERDKAIRRAMWRRDNQRRRGEPRRPVREIAAEHSVSRTFCYYVQHRHLQLEHPESRTCPKCHGRGVIVDLETNSARLCSCRPAPPPLEEPEPAPRRRELERLDLGAAIRGLPLLFASAPAQAGASGSGASETDRRPGPGVDEESPLDPPDAVGVRPAIAAGESRRPPSLRVRHHGGRTPERGLHADSLGASTTDRAGSAASRAPPGADSSIDRPPGQRFESAADCGTGEVCLDCRGLGFVGELGALEACTCAAGQAWAERRRKRP